MSESEPTLETYHGSCLCGAFTFEAKLPKISAGYACNCSICSSKGYLWQFPPPDGFTVTKGDRDTTLKSYRFGPKNKRHQFCPTCGTAVLCSKEDSPPGQGIGINIRTLKGLDVFSLKVSGVDGGAYKPDYEPPVFTGPEPAGTVEGGKTYQGSCHCGDVKTAVKVQPLDGSYKGRLVEGNCDTCSRGAYVWIYLNKDQVVVEGRDNLAYYAPGAKIWRKAFCKNCGVHVLSETNPLSDAEESALSQADKERRDHDRDVIRVSVRVLDGVDLDSLKPTRQDCAAEGHSSC